MFNEMTKILYMSICLSFFSIFIGCNNMDVSKYEGDGKIVSVGPLFFRGYIVEFEKVLLTNSFSRQYKIVNLPKNNKTIWCGLFVKSVNDIGFSVDASLTLTLTLESPKKGIVFSCTAPLKEWRHSQVVNEGYRENFYYFFNGDNSSSFNYKDISKEDHLLLSVNYESQSKLDIESIVQIRSGGHK